MSEISRRKFLGGAAAATGAAVLGSALPAQADAARRPRPRPAGHRRHGDLRDIGHIVVVMQENRSFDHYFGTLRGVRGFGDRSIITLPGGGSVWQQPTGAPWTLPEDGAATQYPWKLSAEPVDRYPADHRPPDSWTGAQGYGGTGHGWTDQHGAWFGGWMNGWQFAKEGPTTMGYLDRSDLPWHYALADLYTVGDAYHCSVMSATGPNRTYLWSGTINADKEHGDFTAYAGGDELGKLLLWESYGETLENAGVSWHLYQCLDNYGDNGLQYFKTFADTDPIQGGTPAPGNVFYDHGIATVPEPITGLTANADNLANAIRADVLAGRLPQVSWVVSNQAFSEHPDGAPNDGAYLLDRILKALNADPAVFNRTLVVLDYDENDGQFDHVPPPVPAPGERDEFVGEDEVLQALGLTAPVPVGLGFRVPLVLISPWTRGGWVTSEVSDHTSVIQLMEQWTTALGTPAICPNISDWRRRVCGDLVDALDFDAPVYGLPELPSVSVIGTPPDDSYHPDPVTNEMPVQEPGTKPARPLPYQPNANLDRFTFGPGGRVTAHLSFSNDGRHVRRASHFAVYSNVDPSLALADYPAAFPGQYTVDPSQSGASRVPGAVEVGAGHGEGRYDLTVIGPNRFLRHFTGDAAAPGAAARVEATIDEPGHRWRPALALRLFNGTEQTVTFTITSEHHLRDRLRSYRVRPGVVAVHRVDPLARSGGWYDLTVALDAEPGWSRRYVGHLEDGRPSITAPDVRRPDKPFGRQEPLP